MKPSSAAKNFRWFLLMSHSSKKKKILTVLLKVLHIWMCCVMYNWRPRSVAPTTQIEVWMAGNWKQFLSRFISKAVCIAAQQWNDPTACMNWSMIQFAIIPINCSPHSLIHILYIYSISSIKIGKISHHIIIAFACSSLIHSLALKSVGFFLFRK